MDLARLQECLDLVIATKNFRIQLEKISIKLENYQILAKIN